MYVCLKLTKYVIGTHTDTVTTGHEMIVSFPAPSMGMRLGLLLGGYAVYEACSATVSAQPLLGLLNSHHTHVETDGACMIRPHKLKFAVYRHCLNAILKIIHYLSLSCEYTQNVKTFNIAMSKTVISPQHLANRN